jgi:hypothetical protein
MRHCLLPPKYPDKRITVAGGVHPHEKANKIALPILRRSAKGIRKGYFPRHPNGCFLNFSESANFCRHDVSSRA